MASDPWKWTGVEVADFFRNNAHSLLDDMPNARLPNMTLLAQALQDNEVCGSVLFESVDAGFLRDDCGIKKLGQRSAVLHCIRRLKAISATYSNGGEVTTPRTPISIGTTPAVAATAAAVAGAQQEQPSPVPTFDSSNAKRAGEIEVQDSSGRKRRKLTLVPQPQAQTATLVAHFFNDAKLPVDRIFFGDTRLGQELRGSEPASIMTRNPASQLDTPTAQEKSVTDGNDLQPDDTNFQFQAPDTLAGEATFVYKRLHRFFGLDAAESQSESTKEISRNGRDAIAVLPYTEKLLVGSKAQSALVFQMQGDRCISKRENAAFLDSGFEYDNIQIEGLPEGDGSSTGEWDFLAAKHKSTEGDEVLPAYLESESGGSLASLEEEIENDRLEDAEEEGPEQSLDTIIDGALEAIRAEWKAKVLPQKEKRAWTEWKKTRQSRTIRDALIGGARDLIQQFEQRIERFKKEMHREQWHNNHKQIVDQCKTMEATVEDIEEQRWKIEVWQSRKKPHHIVRHGNRTNSGQTSAAHAQSQLPHVPINDRFSVERDIEMDPGDDDDFHSAQGGPTPVSPGLPLDEDEPHSQEIGQDEDGDASDEMSEQDAPTPMDTDTDHDVAMALVDDSDYSEYARAMSSPSRPGKPQPSRASYTDHEDDSDPFIPSSAFFRKRAAGNVTTPGTRKGANNAEEPIEISSDSTPAKPRSIKKLAVKKEILYSPNPENASAQDVDGWNLDDLVLRGDRARVLIKLLTVAGPETREAISRKFRAIWQPRFIKEMGRTLEKLRADYSYTGEGHDDPMVPSGKLFLSWNFCRPRHYLEDDASDIPWTVTLADKGGQIAHFCRLLEKFVRIHRLWNDSNSGSSPSKSSLTLRGSQVIELDSDDEDLPAGTPKKRKRKEVKLGLNAEQSQAAAHLRQQRYKELQSKGSSNSQELQAMIQSDPSNSTVVINPLASKEEEFIFIDRKIAHSLKEHQIRGIQFMWREITADGENSGQGCILAHTMGLGKTVQTIATLVAINGAAQSTNPSIYEQIPRHLRPDDIHQRQLRMLIMLPAALIQNWKREIRKWASHILTNVFAIESGMKVFDVIEKLKDWYKIGGVLFITYGLLQKYVNWRDGKLSESIYGPQFDRYLIEGPELVVADEVHTLKNPGAKVTKAALSIQTESRIGLTGTPMSNDVDEIYSLINFAAPDYLGEKRWFNQQFSNPISQGNRSDSTKPEVRRMLKKLAVLRNKIEPKVDRADITVLRGSLKPKLEFVIMMPLSKIQRTVYRKYLAALEVDTSGGGAISQTRIFAWLAALTLLMNHPLAFKRKLLEPPKPRPVVKSKKKERESTPPVSDSGSGTPSAEIDIDPEDLPDMDEAIRSLAFSEEVKQDMISGIDDELHPEHSKKMEMLLLILRLSAACDDKVLVFSGSIPTLNYVGELLKKKGIACGRIDGQVPIPQRQPIIDAFHSGKTKVMLMSTKAGVGLNIQGANRVVVLDFGFNPSHEEQAVGRAYRIGQPKPVFVYRLVIGGTFEDNIYDKQMFKTSLTQRVVDKKNPRRIALGNAGDWLYEPRDTPQEDLRQWLGKDEAVLHRVLRKQIHDGDSYAGPRIRKLTTIETLQEDAADAPLDEVEQREVEEEIAMSRNLRSLGKQPGPSASQAAMPPPRLPGSTVPLARSGPTPGYASPGLVKFPFPTQSRAQPHGLPNVGSGSRPPSSAPHPASAYQAGRLQPQSTSSAPRPSSSKPQA